MNIKAIVGMGLVASAALMGACQTNPETGHSSYLSMSKDDEVKLGEEAGPQMTQEFGGKVDSAACQKYVTDLGMKLKDHIDRQDYLDLPWEFTLLNSDVVNAFALPGGKVFITRGLAIQLTSEAQMAGVLGHEIGHVTAEHADERITSQTTMDIALQAAAAAAGVAGGSVAEYAQLGLPAVQYGGGLVLLKYGREEEIEADGLGMRYMSRAGYDPKAQREVMELLGRLAGNGGAPEFLSTHPTSATRTKKIDAELAGEYAATQGNPAYQMYADRYKTGFLEPLSKTTPPAKAPAK